MGIYPDTLSFFYCTAIRPLPTMAFCLSIFTINSMAVVRCRIMCYPHKPKLQRKAVYYWIAALWLLSFTVNLPTMLVAMVSTQGHCTGNWSSRKQKDAYIIGFLLLKCLLPLIIIICASVKIGIYLVQNKRPQTCLDENQALNYRDVARKENVQIVHVLGAIVLLFGLCTSPHQIAWMLYQLGEQKEKEIANVIFTFSPILQICHACVNPFIYGVMSKQFRGDYLKICAQLLDCPVNCCRRIGRRNSKNHRTKEFNSPIRWIKNRNKELDQTEEMTGVINMRQVSDEEPSAEISMMPVAHDTC